MIDANNTPYVGPRPFAIGEKHKFFGRDNEARDLLSIVSSQRCVLFYAQSGAGKSSLVNTRLVPGLKGKGFEVLPVARVKSAESDPHDKVDNIFIYNLLLTIDQSETFRNEAETITLNQRFAGMELEEFLNYLVFDSKFLFSAGLDFQGDLETIELSEGFRHEFEIHDITLSDEVSIEPQSGRDEWWITDNLSNQTYMVSREGEALHIYAELSYFDDNHQYPDSYEPKPRVLIIDQFEEILTAHTMRPRLRQQRIAFFEQLGKAMRVDRWLWVVLSMRADYIAGLDPYVHLLPGGLRARYSMERMNEAAALKAIRNPVADVGWDFEKDAAEELSKNLRRIHTAQMQAAGEPEVYDDYVEPVQLQVVCLQLWKNLDKQRPDKKITMKDLAELAGGAEDLPGFVDNALAQFYEQALAHVLGAPDIEVTELDLRNWFADELITEDETRDSVFLGREAAGGLPIKTVRELESRYLIRAQSRPGGIWYELVHDRFIEPILLSNQKWLLQQPLVQLAKHWKNSGRDSAYVLGSKQLAYFEDTNWQGLGPLVQDFMEASRKDQEDKKAAHIARAEEQRRQQAEAQRRLNEEKRRRAEEAARAAEEQERAAQLLAEEQRKRADENARAAKRMKRLNIALAMTVAIALILAALAFRQSIRAEDARVIAEGARAEAEANLVQANKNLKLAKENEIKVVRALQIAEQALAEKQEAEQRADALELVNAVMKNEVTDPEARVLLARLAVSRTLSLADTSAREMAKHALRQAIWDRTLLGITEEGSFRQDNFVYGVLFHPDGVRLATAGGDGTAKIWDTDTQQPLRSFEIFVEDPLNAVANVLPITFDATGQYMAAATGPTTVTVWNADSGEIVKNFAGEHDDVVWSIAFSPDGEQLVTADRSGVANLWDFDTGQITHILSGHKGGISGAAFNPESNLVATAGEDTMVRVWDVLTGKPVSTLTGHTAWVNRVAFAPDGSQLATASDDGTVRIWDANTGQPVHTLVTNGEPVHSLAFGQPEAGNLSLAAVNNDGVVHVWHRPGPKSAWRPFREFPTHQDTVWNIAFSPDGARVATASSDASAKVWALPADNQLYSRLGADLSGGSEPEIASSPDGSRLAILGSGDNPQIWDLGIDQLEPFGQAITLTTDFEAAFTPAEELVAVSGDHTTVLETWDISMSAASPLTQTFPTTITAYALSGDGSRLAVVNSRNSVTIWERETGEWESKASVPVDDVLAPPSLPAQTPPSSDKELASQGKSEDRGAPTADRKVGAIAFNIDGSRLAILDSDNRVGIWSIDTDAVQPITDLSLQEDVTHIALNGAGNLLVTANQDGTIKLWQVGDTVKSPLLNSFQADGRVADLQFDSETTYLAVAEENGWVNIYPLLDVETLYDIACQYTSRNLTQDVWQDYQREVGEDPLATLICPQNPLELSIVVYLLENGQEQEARELLEQANVMVEVPLESVDRAIDEARIELAKKQIRGGDFAGAWSTLYSVTVNEKFDPQQSLAVELADAYKEMCESADQDFYKTFACNETLRLLTQAREQGGFQGDPLLVWSGAMLSPLHGLIDSYQFEEAYILVGSVAKEFEDLDLKPDLKARHNITSTLLSAYFSICTASSDSDDLACQEVVSLAPRIDFGQVITAELVNTEGDFWVIEGEDKWARLAMEDVDSGMDPWLTVFNSDGTWLAESDSLGPEESISNLALSEDEIYLIRARASGGLGSYMLSLNEEIPNPIVFNVPQSGDTSSQPLWSFSGQEGDIVRIEMREDGSGLDTVVSLYGPESNEPLVQNDDASDRSTDSFIPQYELPATGIYVVNTRGLEGADGTYTLLLTSIEPQPITTNSSITGNIASDIVWTFDGTRGQVLTITSRPVEGEFDPDFVLRSPDGGPVGDAGTQKVIDLGQTGPYTILLEAAHGSSGVYQLSLNTITNTQSISIGSRVEAELTQPAGDYWLFFAESGRAISATVESRSFSPQIELHSPTGDLLGRETNTDDVSSSLSHATPFTGTYILAVKDADLTKTGPYTLTLTQTELLPVLVWTAYTEVDAVSYRHVLEALERFAPSAYDITLTDTTDADALGRMLQGRSVFLVPWQKAAEGDILAEIATRFGPTLEDFVRQGGRVVSLTEYIGFLRPAGLLDARQIETLEAESVEVVSPKSPIVQELPEQIETATYTDSYQIADRDAVIIAQSERGDAVVATRPIGLGQVVLVGYDYTESNEDVDRLLVNAVVWPSSQ